MKEALDIIFFVLYFGQQEIDHKKFCEYPSVVNLKMPF